MSTKRTRMRCFSGLFLLASVSCYMTTRDENTWTASYAANNERASNTGSGYDNVATPGGVWSVRGECAYPQEVVFFIHSRPHHWSRRAAIRDSLFEEKAKRFFNWTGIFVVERSRDDAAELAWTELEARVMGDVLLIPRQGRNSAPRKLLLGMKWVLQNCARALYVIKVDDDVMIEPFVLFEYLMSNVEPRGRSLHCVTMATCSRNRIPPPRKRAFGVEGNVSASSLVRSFCSERAIIMNLPILTDLLRASRRQPAWYRWSDTAYVTGQLAVAAGLGHVDFGSRVAWEDMDAYSFVDGGWWMFFHLRGTFAMTTLRRALWLQGIWNEALADDKIRKGLSRRTKPAQYDPELRYRYDD
ncbi:hypothetical protein HPB50_001056 [Hyalomma asiaticum]|uniref:Uncharacterized protein n=1 Tax=Hyalomma asiaticum TaxID=266040 RepID=A0ACB7RKI0_HYAAI|nr:hypothetical protein HPB50_001056 [Hyalomma asiaticum]